MDSNTRILLVDDDRTILQFLSRMLVKKGYIVSCAENHDDAVRSLEQDQFHIVITDLKMPGKTGMDLLEHIKKRFPRLPVILLTAHGTVETAVEALKNGASDYLTKPVRAEELDLVIRKVVSYDRIAEQNALMKDELHRSSEAFLKTEDPVLTRNFEMIESFRDINSTVLLQGESGTGKEVFARHIHNSGNRSTENFIAINCGSIPESLIESELFGYEKGAFTDARTSRKGKLEQADRGTLFLDEINELPQKAQVALLRFIQEREIVPLGSSRRIHVDVRIIAATNKNLQHLVAKGTFREDLFYRIHVFPLLLPPLRERTGDIVPLSLWFLEKFAREYNKPSRILSPVTEKKLLGYSWPGNIRELRNCIERAVILNTAEAILPEHLLLMDTPVDRGDFSFPLEPIISLKDLERKYIRWLQERGGLSMSEIAGKLGLTTRALRYKMSHEKDPE